MLGIRIKSLRKEKKYSQLELAKLLNVSQSTIAYYEKEQKQPSHDTLTKLADIFNVTVDYLLGRTDIKYTNTENKLIHEMDLTPEILMDKYNLVIEGKKASKEEIEEVIQYIKALRIIKNNSNNDKE
jgi:transcriptional regulator with XRE-family HTH domain